MSEKDTIERELTYDAINEPEYVFKSWDDDDVDRDEKLKRIGNKDIEFWKGEVERLDLIIKCMELEKDGLEDDVKWLKKDVFMKDELIKVYERSLDLVEKMND